MLEHQKFTSVGHFSGSSMLGCNTTSYHLSETWILEWKSTTFLILSEKLATSSVISCKIPEITWIKYEQEFTTFLEVKRDSIKYWKLLSIVFFLWMCQLTDLLRLNLLWYFRVWGNSLIFFGKNIQFFRHFSNKGRKQVFFEGGEPRARVMDKRMKN